MSDIYQRFSQFADSMAKEGIRLDKATITLPKDDFVRLVAAFARELWVTDDIFNFGGFRAPLYNREYERSWRLRMDDAKEFSLMTRTSGVIKFVMEPEPEVKIVQTEPPKYDENYAPEPAPCRHNYVDFQRLGDWKLYRVCTKCNEGYPRD